MTLGISVAPLGLGYVLPPRSRGLHPWLLSFAPLGLFHSAAK